MTRRRAIGLLSLLLGLALSAPLAAIGVWMLTTRVVILAVAPSFAWAVGTSGAVGLLLAVFGALNVLRGGQPGAP
jgi:hypothetical protein